jgi:hypothetical protein
MVCVGVGGNGGCVCVVTLDGMDDHLKMLAKRQLLSSWYRLS